MAITLNVEDGTGLANANTFVGLDAAIAFLATQPGPAAAAFVAAGNSDASSMQALIGATDRLDGEDWEGNQVNPDVQRLKFGRRDMRNPDTGRRIPNTPLPRWLTEATALLAAQIRSDAGASLRQNKLAAFESVKVGPIELQTRGSVVMSIELPEGVSDRIDPYTSSDDGMNVRLVRG